MTRVFRATTQGATIWFRHELEIPLGITKPTPGCYPHVIMWLPWYSRLTGYAAGINASRVVRACFDLLGDAPRTGKVMTMR